MPSDLAHDDGNRCDRTLAISRSINVVHKPNINVSGIGVVVKSLGAGYGGVDIFVLGGQARGRGRGDGSGGLAKAFT